MIAGTSPYHSGEPSWEIGLVEPIDKLRPALGDRYTIERELGRGATATVYLAQDLKHRRPVALKVLRPELASALGPERFLREIEIVAGLSHPHILPLFDSGEGGGFLYYVMPFVDGESLRDRLERTGPLSLGEALQILREVADALGYAHKRDIVHRDIKPENILLSTRDGSGHALVADFGIARALSAAGATNLTDTGLAIGTPTYMSPEQAGGDRLIDPRADIYALGCVLYEMLAGHPPFQGVTAREMLARHAVDPVPALRSGRPDLPESVERAVTKALAKSPADRFATTEAFVEALGSSETASRPWRKGSRLTVGFAAVVAVAALGYVVWPRQPVATGSPRSIAVLPFVNIGGDPANEPFSDGMSEDLTTALAKIEGLGVAARTSAFSFKGKNLDVREIGARLQVGYLLEGSVQRAGGQLRVTAQLIDVATGLHRWADKYERTARDMFAVQDEIVRSIVGELRIQLSAPTKASLANRSTDNPEAHDLYLQGRYFFEKRDSASLRKAQEYFERAIRLDSTSARAYAGLSDAYSHSSVFGYAAPRDRFPQAKAAVAKALALDSNSVEANTSQGFIAVFYDWDWKTAERAFGRALALDPRYPPAHLFYAWYLVAADRLTEAVEEAQTALRLDPFSLVISGRLASMLFLAHRYEEALEQGRKQFDLDPQYFQGRGELGRAYLLLGRCSEALEALEHTPDLLATQWRGIRGYAYAICGRRSQAVSEIQRLKAQARAGQYASHYAIAAIHAGLGDKERALVELDSAYAERAWAMFLIKSEPAFAGLHADPRFAALVSKVGLSPIGASAGEPR